MSGHDATVTLVLMPYADVSRPSLALGTLKACLTRAGIACTVEYANLRFADRLGLGMRTRFLGRLLGEWTFAAAAFPESPGSSAREILGCWRYFSSTPPEVFSEPRFIEGFERLRAYAIPFVDQLAQDVLARRPRIVGCSSTFEQHCASLALLRRIRELDPSVVTLLGGANCEAEMGWATIRSFPWVDVVVSGEADELLAPLCEMLLAHGSEPPSEELPVGVMVREHVRRDTFGKGGLPPPRAVVDDVNANPVPDNTDYFAALAGCGLRTRVTPGLLVEFSRGCWWGQKHHCTFCGLNGGGMAYRVKRPERALAELDALAKQSGVSGFMVVDNILDMGYLHTVLPALAERDAPYRLFFETKANLKREQVALLARAGVVWIQPGLEAFHDELLRLMDKGTTAATNLQVLKYCREFGVYATWNLLFGFPGEDDAWHATVAEWLPLVYHLQPPQFIGRVLYDRFSLYQQTPERYGLRLRPAPSYAEVYPLPDEALGDLAYFFYDDSSGAQQSGPGVGALTARVLEWHHLFERGLRPVLGMTDRGDAIDIYDTRPCATARRLTLERPDAAVYRACEPAATYRELCRRVSDVVADEGQVTQALARLQMLGLLVEVHDKYLALAVAGDIPRLVDIDEFPGGDSGDIEDFTPGALDEFERKTRALVGSDEVRLHGG